jgi:hypothetical protein
MESALFICRMIKQRRLDMNKLIITIVTLAMITLSCSGGGGGGSGGADTQYPRFTSGDNDIVNFTFPVSKNGQLTGDVTGIISGTNINLTIPYSTGRSNLIAEFTANSTDVKVNSVKQESGVTANDFTTPVEYTVTAENGGVKKFSVTVLNASGSEKSITAFSIEGSEGTVNQDSGTIAVTLPPHTAVTSLRASFSTTGKSVNVGDAVQESGVTANDFTSPVSYTVYAMDGTTKTYTVTVTVQPATTKEITSFGFKQGINATVGTDVMVTYPGQEINIVLPYGSVLTALKATFEITGDKVTVNGIVQESGVTQNDFSADVIYRVTAQDGSYNDYTVKASVAKNDARAITKFILDGQNSIIDESARSITVTFPSTKDITGLIATFISTGINVSVSGKDQVSGVTVNDFSSPLVYTVTAENGTTADYTVKVNKNADISGLWNFEQASDGTFTIEGAKTIAGAIGNALYFNRGDYVRVPDSDSLTLASEGSIEVIILAYSHKHYAGLVHKGVLKDFSDESYNLQFPGLTGTDGTLRFTLFNDSGAFAYVESTSKLAIDTWYYVAVTWDASAINLYVNGVLESSTANTTGKVRDSAGDLIIGAQLPVEYSSAWSNLYFHGIIDMVRISGKAVSSSEISATYQSLPFASGGLTAYIHKVAVKNITLILVVINIILLILLGIFIYNRKHSGEIL